MIEKIEKLDHLTQLRELHLANNCIPKIEGLDCLVHLTVLNLNGNLIETLPAPVFKKLKELQAFHIAHNRIGSVSAQLVSVKLQIKHFSCGIKSIHPLKGVEIQPCSQTAFILELPK